MTPNQIYAIVNTIQKEVLGESALQSNEDLGNIVDIGNAVINAGHVDNYVKKLVNHIGKVIFVDRLYAGGVPSVLMDAWEYGSVVEKISAILPAATENESWDLTNAVSYDPNVFYKPTVNVKFFNSKTTFEIPLSFTELQVKESFSSANQMNAFLSMLTTAVENSMTVKFDSLIMRTINNMIGEAILHSPELTTWAGTPFNSTPTIDLDKDATRAVNMLKLYNDLTTPAGTLTVADALTSPDFIRFATYTIGLYCDRMTRISKLFNATAKERFTPKDKQHVVLLSDFAKASETYLRSATFNDEFVALPNHETVPFWQGSGTTYAFEDVSTISVKTSSGYNVDVGGILGVIFDRDALGVTNLDRRVTTNYNPKAEFYTNFYKFDAGFFNDLDENFVVFYMDEGNQSGSNE